MKKDEEELERKNTEWHVGAKMKVILNRPSSFFSPFSQLYFLFDSFFFSSFFPSDFISLLQFFVLPLFYFQREIRTRGLPEHPHARLVLLRLISPDLVSRDFFE